MHRQALLLAFTLAVAAPAAAATPAAPPAPAAAQIHPYESALGAVDNYGSCRGAGASAVLGALRARMATLEAEAARKGLRPTLDRVRQRWLNRLAVSTMTACAGGLARARSDARAAVAAFADWVAAQPARTP
jgi:hypothetical protein